MADETNLPYVVIQAGGKGTRLEQYTWNKPKCLVPIDGKPLLYHLFDAFPGSDFAVIVDFKKDVVARFLETFPPPGEVSIIQMAGGSGNVAGVSAAVASAPDNRPVIVVWCDLKFDQPPNLPAVEQVVVATTRSFRCRWSFDDKNALVEHPSSTSGVVGLFRFPNKDYLADVPSAGEFVQWVASTGVPLRRHEVNELKEVGTIDALFDQWAASGHARFFNHIDVTEHTIVKKAKLPAYQALINGEVAWYQEAQRLGFVNSPSMLATEPLTLQRIIGRHPFEFSTGSRGRALVLERIIDRIKGLHSLKSAPASADVLREVYLDKTLQRLSHLRKLLPEVMTTESYRVNGRLCRNVLHPHHAEAFAKRVSALHAPEFRFIHGDPTFSNILIDGMGEPWLIDPRSHFGSAYLIGDPNYDWAKLYYSVVGEYDGFNRRQFFFEMEGTGVTLQIKPGGWLHLGGMLAEVCGENFTDVRFIHGLIWLSLSGYVTDDYDSILASYFRGLEVIEDAWE